MAQDNLKEQEYRYDAFISYRHCELDMFVAENLHKLLESFKLPANVAKKLKKQDKTVQRGISRVFRDQEELPLASNLADPIVEALEGSKWLIVICSPRLKESMWCRKEIETFISLHGRDRVMAVLIEGEPEDSFPDELLHKEVEVLRPDGSRDVVVEDVEPLAADVRGVDNKERMKAMKAELLRLVAPMFGLGYDELKQRHRERRIKRIITLVSIVAAICLAFGIVSTFSALTISRQNDELEKQSAEIEKQAAEISEQNESLKAKQAESLASDAMELLEKDDREGAVKKAYEALTKSDGIAMPYTDMARNALMQSVRPYDITSSYRAQYQLVTKGIVQYVFSSPLRTKAMVFDSSDTLTIWSVADNKILGTLQAESNVLCEFYYLFLDEDHIIYIRDDGLHNYDIPAGKDELVFPLESYALTERIRFDASENIVYICFHNELIGLDATSWDKVFVYKALEGESFTDKFRQLENGCVGMVAYVSDAEAYKYYIFDRNAEIFYEMDLGNESYQNSLLSGDSLYMIVSKSVDESNPLSNIVSILRAYSVSSGSLLWERRDVSIYANKLSLVPSKTGTSLVEIGKRGLVDVDPSTGEAISISYSENEILWIGSLESGLIYATAKPMQMYFMEHTTSGFTEDIICNLPNVEIIENMGEGYVMASKNSNRLVYYCAPDVSSFTDLEGGFATPETENINWIYNKEEVMALGLPDEDLIRNVAIDPDGKYLCVTGKDNMVRLFTADTHELLSTWELRKRVADVDEFLGTDKDGNLYLASDMQGFVLSPDFKLIGEMEALRGVDKENNRLIFGMRTSEERCSAPIYSTDELLQLAEKYIQ